MTDRTRKALTAARDLLARSSTYQERHDALRLIDGALADRSPLDELDALRSEIVGADQALEAANEEVLRLRAALNTKEAKPELAELGINGSRCGTHGTSGS
jgi:hypothetical protein